MNVNDQNITFMLKEIMKIKLHIFLSVHNVVNCTSMYFKIKLTV